MEVVRWGKDLAVHIPPETAEALGLQEGDNVQIVSVTKLMTPEREQARHDALARLSSFRVTLPDNWKLDRTRRTRGSGG